MVKIDEKRLEKEKIDIHYVKKDCLGQSVSISHFDLAIDDDKKVVAIDKNGVVCCEIANSLDDLKNEEEYKCKYKSFSKNNKFHSERDKHERKSRREAKRGGYAIYEEEGFTY